MNASQISRNMKTQVSTLDEIKKLYDRAVKDKLASEEELEALKAYIDSIDEPWHVMAKIAQAEKDSKAKKEEKPKEDAKAAKADAKEAAKEAAKQESLVDEAQDEEPVDAEADDDLSFLD